MFVAIAVSAFAVAGLVRPKQASAGVDIKVENGQLIVRLTDLESRPDVIRSALRSAGLNATVQAVPVGPSEVGRFVGGVGSGPSELHVIDDRDGTFAGFAIPVGWAGHLDLIVGRRAAPTEGYFRPSNAFAPGEPLACADLPGSTIATAAELVPSGVSIRVLAVPVRGQPEPMVSLEEAVASHPNNLVAAAEAFSPTDVVLFATPDGSQPLAAPRPAEGQC
jgi:hypothetical protein